MFINKKLWERLLLSLSAKCTLKFTESSGAFKPLQEYQTPALLLIFQWKTTALEIRLWTSNAYLTARRNILIDSVNLGEGVLSD